MNVYYNVALLVFRVGAVAWFLYVLQSVIATYGSFAAMAGMFPSNPLPATMSIWSLPSMMWLGLLIPTVVFFAAPLLAKTCTWGTKEQ